MGKFSYSEYRVPRSMSLFVKKIWTLDNLESSSLVLDRFALPNGCFNIAIIRGSGLEITHMESMIHLSPGTYFCGQMTEALGIEIRPNSRATMLQLFPWTPIYFTGLGMDSYADRFCRADGILPDLSVDTNPSNGELCRSIAANWGSLAKSGRPAMDLQHSTSLIMESCGDITIKAVSAEVGCSARYLQKLFKKGLGLTPKKFADIIRLRSIVDKIASSGEGRSDFTGLAIANSFYDQAHFTNAFHAMFKTTPKQFDSKTYFLSYIR
ncbi:MAG: AraC family transcriptional regulator [Pedobacter sp.]|nr:MAG: AraC family transcriptional regulator [Pedobacter sp.]